MNYEEEDRLWGEALCCRFPFYQWDDGEVQYYVSTKDWLHGRYYIRKVEKKNGIYEHAK